MAVRFSKNRETENGWKINKQICVRMYYNCGCTDFCLVFTVLGLIGDHKDLGTEHFLVRFPLLQGINVAKAL